jgi:hypothetical protein
MKFRGWVLCSAALILALFGASGRGAERAPGPPVPPAAEVSVPFAPGETLTYDVSWSVFSHAGLISTTVKERSSYLGSPALYIVAEGGLAGFLSKLYHAQYKADTLLDLATLSPRRGMVYGEEGRRRFTKITRFDPATGKAEYEVQASPTSSKRLDVPPGTQDLLSVLYAFRAAAGYPRGARAMTVTWNGQLYKADLAIDGKEWVATGLGTLSAWRMKPRVFNERGQLDNHKMIFWFSDDRQHLPLRLKIDVFIGAVDIVLRDVRPPPG